ncbi:MAG: methyl-accepting chemotaxis protein [Spirochaetaceae bacterium]|jgi:methyl-accepting chemotaxis protein|nr:methyl-accepting chemotaxis protein [Spirochaetaceae bacterium]
MKIKIKMTLITAILVIGAVTTLSVVLVIRASNALYKSAVNYMEDEVEIAGDKVVAWYQIYMDRITTIAHIMGDFEQFEAGQRRDQFLNMMRPIMSTNDNIMEIYAVFQPNVLDGMDALMKNRPESDEQGNFTPSFSKISDDNITLRSYPNAKTLLANPTRDHVVTDPIPAEYQGQSTFFLNLSVPIIHLASKDLIGTIGLRIKTSAAQQLAEQTKLYGVGACGLFTTNGTLIAITDKSLVGKNLKNMADRYTQQGVDDIQDTIKTGTPHSMEVGGKIFAAYAFNFGNAKTNWVILCNVPRDTVMVEVDRMKTFAFTIAGIFIVIIAFVVFFVVGNMVRPIIKVTNTLKDIAEGEGDLTKTVAITSKDEIGDMARYFNQTLGKIRKLVLTIKNQTAALSDIGNDLSVNMTQTASAINEINANLGSIRGRILNQSASVTETNATMEQITTHIDKLSEYIGTQTNSVTKSSAAIEQMIANIQSVTHTLVQNSRDIQELADASEVGRNSLQEVSGDIQAISLESEGLFEINAVMENIASQTNLLSMNAAIEAAHAGEAGKGFAVVADEIRKLAESSGEQSKTISAVLKKIHDSIDKITQSTDNVLQKFEAIDNGVRTVTDQAQNIKNAMEEQDQGSQQILEVINELNSITQQVKNSSGEMLEGSKQIITESRNLEGATQEISNGMNEMSTGADHITIAVNRVHTISSDNKSNIDILVKEVSKFKVD